MSIFFCIWWYPKWLWFLWCDIAIALFFFFFPWVLLEYFLKCGTIQSYSLSDTVMNRDMPISLILFDCCWIFVKPFDHYQALLAIPSFPNILMGAIPFHRSITAWKSSTGPRAQGSKHWFAINQPLLYSPELDLVSSLYRFLINHLDVQTQQNTVELGTTAIGVTCQMPDTKHGPRTPVITPAAHPENKPSSITRVWHWRPQSIRRTKHQDQTTYHQPFNDLKPERFSTNTPPTQPVPFARTCLPHHLDASKKQNAFSAWDPWWPGVACPGGATTGAMKDSDWSLIWDWLTLS